MTSDGDGLGRRQLLKVAGLAGVTNLEALSERAPSARTVAPDGTARETLLPRLPAPADTPDGRYDVVVTPQLDDDVLQAPGLLGDAEAHARVVSPRATLTMGLGVSSGPPALVARLERHGFERAEPVAGRPLLVRRGRYAQRLALVDDGTVVLGRSPSLSPVRSLARGVAVTRSTPVEERLPAVARLREHLGSGAVLSLSPSGAVSPSSGRSEPVATGDRLSLPASGARLRTVAVYGSRTAGEAAVANTAGPSSTVDTWTADDGRVVVHERPVPDEDLPLAGVE